MRLSKRAAARAAGFSDITWRNLESGERQIAKGVTVDPSPRDDTLLAACQAVSADPQTVFAAAGRPLPDYAEEPGSGLAGIHQLEPEDQELVAAIVDRLRRF